MKEPQNTISEQLVTELGTRSETCMWHGPSRVDNTQVASQMASLELPARGEDVDGIAGQAEQGN